MEAMKSVEVEGVRKRAHFLENALQEQHPPYFERRFIYAVQKAVADGADEGLTRDQVDLIDDCLGDHLQDHRAGVSVNTWDRAHMTGS